MGTPILCVHSECPTPFSNTFISENSLYLNCRIAVVKMCFLLKPYLTVCKLHDKTKALLSFNYNIFTLIWYIGIKMEILMIRMIICANLSKAKTKTPPHTDQNKTKQTQTYKKHTQKKNKNKKQTNKKQTKKTKTKQNKQQNKTKTNKQTNKQTNTPTNQQTKKNLGYKI